MLLTEGSPVEELGAGGLLHNAAGRSSTAVLVKSRLERFDEAMLSVVNGCIHCAVELKRARRVLG